ncbi:Hypp4246 [Branchiostoma lanceolatum]|uniref:Hypp4246 protein n=1 Tax=Branchiostoma lanceolatum TaxID=7740 RepID=A0A8K0A6N4_BRALA|nr:Hypp4246 [Branchiostoma lanceolatum]
MNARDTCYLEDCPPQTSVNKRPGDVGPKAVSWSGGSPVGQGPGGVSDQGPSDVCVGSPDGTLSRFDVNSFNSCRLRGTGRLDDISMHGAPSHHRLPGKPIGHGRLCGADKAGTMEGRAGGCERDRTQLWAAEQVERSDTDKGLMCGRKRH